MHTPQQLPTFQELVESGLQKFDVVIPAIEEYKKNYLPLKIKSVDDEEGYEKVSKALRVMVSKRNEVEEKRKELKADSLAYGKAVDNKAKEITFMLTPIEEHLRSEKDRIDEEIEAIKERKILAEKERINIRNRRLLQAGMKLVGNEYFYQNPNDLADVQILPSVNLETLDDLSFDEYVEKINSISKQQQAIFEAEQKRLAEEKDKMELEQKKIREEMAEMKLQRTRMRIEYLFSLGLNLHPNNNHICYPKGERPEFIPVAFYPEYENVEDWNSYFSMVKSKIAEIESLAQKEEIDKQNKIEELKKQAEDKLKEERVKQENLEKERIAQLSDKEKFIEYQKMLLEVAPPSLKTKKWKMEVAALRNLIQNYE